MRDTNEIHYTNDDPLPDLRYTNDDIPYNEYEVGKFNPQAPEFGEDNPQTEDEGTARVRFSSDYDIQKIASTFVVVTLVAMAVVLDDSPFGEFFDPVMGDIREAFGISGIDPGYSISFDLELIPTDTDISYYVTFAEVPDGTKTLIVKEGSEEIQRLSLDSALSGVILNLTPGTTYTVSVDVDGKTAGSPQTVSTLGTYDGSPIVKLLSYKNNNLVNRNAADDGGYLNFQIAVIDRNNVCADFWATLETTDPNGDPVSSELQSFTGAPTDMQAIEVLDIWFDPTMSSAKGAHLTIGWTESGTGNSFTETIYI